MKKILRWVIYSLLGLIMIAALTAFILQNRFTSQFDKKRDITPAAITIPTDSVSLMRGKVLSLGCAPCHGYDLAGKAFFNDPTIGYMSSPNLTPAKGSATEHYSDADWVRAIRHGVGPSGKVFMVMPSDDFCFLSDKDLGSLIGYLKTLEAIEKPQGATQFTFMAKVLAGAGVFGNLDSLFPANVINHQAVQHVTAPPIDNTFEYGKYIVNYTGCTKCHGKNLTGGKHPDPVGPSVPDISNSGNFGKWTLEQFKTTLRSGKTPEGKIMNAEFMPFAAIGGHSDSELEALYKYIKSLPAGK
jgi:cytochrome c553